MTRLPTPSLPAPAGGTPFRLALLLAALAAPHAAMAQQVQSTALSDKLHRGDGVIDLMKNIGGNNLSQYFNETGGLLLLGVDVNESSSGNESNASVGVAIQAAQLMISTTKGDFTFGDFYTSTSAYLREAGSLAGGQYQTLVGQNGSSQITGTGPLDISKFDDVMWFSGIAYEGEITSAKLSIKLLDTPTSKPTAAESFFDFSAGFEDFALLSAADAVLLENANIGVSAMPADISFQSGKTAVEAIAEAAAAKNNSSPAPSPETDNPSGPGTIPSPAPAATPPAAPAPPLVALVPLGLLMLWKSRKPRPAEAACAP